MYVTSLQTAAFSADNMNRWCVMHTKSRQEKALATDLERMEIPYFLPLLNKVRYYGKRKALIVEPLFPGYVFVRSSIDDAYNADRTKRVAQIIKVPDQKRIDWELRNLALALEKEIPLDPYPFLKVGFPVRVKAGPLMGLQGLIESKGNSNRLILQIQMLGQASSLEIDAGILEPID